MAVRVLRVAIALLVVAFIGVSSQASQSQECIPVTGSPNPTPFCRPATAPPQDPGPMPPYPANPIVSGPEEGQFVEPTADTTGPPSDVVPVALTPQNIPYPDDTISDGVLTINTPDAVYDGYQIPYLVRNRAHGTIIRNSTITGIKDVGSDTALVSNEGAQPNGVVPLLYIEWSTLIPDHPSSHLDGVRGSNIALRAVEIAHVVDGIHVHGTTDENDPNAGHVLVMQSWIHDLSTLPSSSQPDGVTHNDGLQAVGGSRIMFYGNKVDGEIQNAAIMIKPDRNAISDVVAIGNWLSGGGCTVNVAEIGEAIPPLMVFSLNEFGKGTTRNPDCAIVVSEKTEPHTLVRGNVWSDGSQPYPNVIPASAVVGLYWDEGLQSWVFDPDRAKAEGVWNPERAASLQQIGSFLGIDLKELEQRLDVPPPSA